MDEIFGIPMGAIMVVLVGLLALCLLSVAWVAWRRPVVFKLGVRNIPRRKAQTGLITVGLMLSTLIIAAALGTGDTIDWSASKAVYDQLGEVDELVVYSRSGDGEGNVNTAVNQRIDEGIVGELEAALAGDGRVDGLMPVLIEALPTFLVAQDADGRPVVTGGVPEAEQAEPRTYLIGVDPARAAEVGGLRATDGRELDLGALEPFSVEVGGVRLDGSEVVVSATMADKLGAEVGDLLAAFYQNRPIPLRVVAVAEDSPLSGRFDSVTPGMTVPLARLQELTGQRGRITLVAVSNRGGVRDGIGLTDGVTDALRAAVAGRDLGVDPIKRDAVELSQEFANVFTGLFLVLGLFSIAVGILLIVLIFTMLAAERRPEMGMTRAVGGQRRMLVQQFVAEGSGYAVLAGLVGSALGVLATVGIAWGFGVLFGDFFPIEAHVTARSLTVAYCLGVTITFAAVAGSSWKISRLNIVAAVRDIPDVDNPTRKRRTLVWATLLVALGVGLAFLGQGISNAFAFYGGMSLWPFGAALLLRYLGVPSRPVFSLVGLALLALWLLPSDVAVEVFGDLGGGFEMFFLSGVFMVAGASILIVQNLGVLLAAVGLLGRLFRGALPAVRTGIAYPGATKGRTGMTIAMFSLIVFSLVTFATINENFVNLFLGDEANAGWDVRADALDANPVGDGSTAAFADALEGAAGADPAGWAAAGRTTANFEAPVRRAGAAEFRLYALRGMDAGFLDGADLFFQARAEGYGDDAAVLRALREEPDAAVIDVQALPAEGPFGGDPRQFRLDDPDGDGPAEAVESGDETFAAVPVEVEGADGTVRTLRVVGIISSKIGSLFGLYARDELTRALFPTADLTSWYVRLAEPGMAEDVARATERALLGNGVQAVSIRDELEEFQRQNTAFLYIIQGFMGLGLLVGIAAVGVIAFRNVVERRQQIGMLRALGWQRRLVAASFLVETAFVVGMGVVSGAILGLWLSYVLFTSDDFGGTGGIEFVVPWGIVGAILGVTVVAALLMAWVPARQASRLAPAEALRYE